MNFVKKFKCILKIEFPPLQNFYKRDALKSKFGTLILSHFNYLQKQQRQSLILTQLHELFFKNESVNLENNGKPFFPDFWVASSSTLLIKSNEPIQICRNRKQKLIRMQNLSKNKPPCLRYWRLPRPVKTSQVSALGLNNDSYPPRRRVSLYLDHDCGKIKPLDKKFSEHHGSVLKAVPNWPPNSINPKNWTWPHSTVSHHCRIFYNVIIIYLRTLTTSLNFM